jgi:hypothetical protein
MRFCVYFMSEQLQLFNLDLKISFRFDTDSKQKLITTLRFNSISKRNVAFYSSFSEREKKYFSLLKVKKNKLFVFSLIESRKLIAFVHKKIKH